MGFRRIVLGVSFHDFVLKIWELVRTVKSVIHLTVDNDFEGREGGDAKFHKQFSLVHDIDLIEYSFRVFFHKSLERGRDLLARAALIVLEVENDNFAFGFLNNSFVSVITFRH